MAGDPIVKRSDVAYFTFGRFQPPTIGHGLLVEVVGSMAAADGADPYIFVSQRKNKTIKIKEPFVSTKDNENPLDVETKIEALKKMYPRAGVSFINTLANECPDPLKAAFLLLSVGYTRLVMLVGSDREKVFRKMFFESFKKIFKDQPWPDLTVRSIGERITVNDGTAKSISGTKMRKAAVSRNFNTFKKGVVTNSFSEDNARALYRNVRHGLGFNGGRYTRRVLGCRRCARD